MLPRPAFIRAVSARLENFLTALNSVRERIATAPLAGPIVNEDVRHVLRMRIFPRPLPYVAYYGHTRATASKITEVYLVRQC